MREVKRAGARGTDKKREQASGLKSREQVRGSGDEGERDKERQGEKESERGGNVRYSLSLSLSIPPPLLLTANACSTCMHAFAVWRR